MVLPCTPDERLLSGRPDHPDEDREVGSVGPIATTKPAKLAFQLTVTNAYGDVDSNELTVTVNPK